jgi:hypothetical protein
MSYRAGMGDMLARRLGCEAGPPRIVCDGCGVVRNVENKDGMPAVWFLDRYGEGKPVPGWSRTRTETETGVTNDDRCPRCKPKKQGKRAGREAWRP